MRKDREIEKIMRKETENGWESKTVNWRRIVEKDWRERKENGNNEENKEWERK